MPEALLSQLVPYPPEFTEALREYCEIAADAIRRNKHADDPLGQLPDFFGGGWCTPACTR